MILRIYLFNLNLVSSQVLTSSILYFFFYLDPVLPSSDAEKTAPTTTATAPVSSSEPKASEEKAP